MSKKERMKIFDEENVDVTPRPLTTWTSDDPTNELEKVFNVFSTEKKNLRRVASVQTNVEEGETDEEEVKQDIFLEIVYTEEKSTEEELLVKLILKKINCFFELPQTVVLKEDPSYEFFVKKKEQFMNSKLSKFMFDRYTMTLHHSKKTKDFQTDKIRYKDFSQNISSYHFYDETKIKTKDEEDFKIKCESEKPDKLEYKRALTLEHEDDFSYSKEFDSLCSVMERLMQYNQFYVPMALYKKIPLLLTETRKDSRKKSYNLKQEEEDTKPMFMNLSFVIYGSVVLKPLWKYNCPQVNEYNVSCMCFNPSNPDLMVSGYNQQDYMKAKDGWICCWCVKNLGFPERLLKLDTGVTAVSFSVSNPYILAVGLFSGHLALYDVSSRPPLLLYSSFSMSSSHTSPVLALRWVSRTGYEAIISTSTDGKVLMWTIINGLQCTEILKVKSMKEPPPPPTQKLQKRPNDQTADTKLTLSQYDGGLCLDFHPEYNEVYLLGTNSGIIHKCSAIHANQFFKSYFGHIAPVYKVKWCPDESTLFASTSADMTVKVWHQDQNDFIVDLLPINPPNTAAPDLAWSLEHKGTLICIFTSELQIWNLFTSILDPIFIYRVDYTYTSDLTSLLFDSRSTSVFLGDNLGDISIFQANFSDIVLKKNEENLSIYQILKNHARK